MEGVDNISSTEGDFWLRHFRYGDGTEDRDCMMYFLFRLIDKKHLVENVESVDLIDYQYWAGLSGAPILDDDGLLAGMLVRGPEREPFITAIPIEKIIWFLDIIIKNEDCTPFKL